jgi:hypothetical protein
MITRDKPKVEVLFIPLAVTVVFRIITKVLERCQILECKKNLVLELITWFLSVLRIRIRDPGSGIGCLFDPWIRDSGSGMGESQHQDPGSGMNNPDHIF